MLLKKGNTGSQVKYLQYTLHILCCSPKTFSGTYDDATETAVKKYQEKYGLTADGIVGDSTWNSLCGEIRPIKQALYNKEYFFGWMDGLATSVVYDAVVKFQKDNGLTADGQVGPVTRNKLMRTGSTEVGDDEIPLEQGDSGDNVIYLQYGLRILCCSPGNIDGSFGTGTYNAVVKFQEKYSLTADGVVGYATWNKMKSLIKEIQTALLSKGYAIGEADGIAGPATYEGVVSFQEDNGLVVDGQAGPATRQLLLGTAGDGANDSFPLKVGSVGPTVRYLQQGLLIMCRNPKSRSGVFDENTSAAVQRFQSSNGLTVDGQVGTQTWETLRTCLKPIQQALANKGYSVGLIDGIAGDTFFSAVLQFQTDNGLTADGMVGSSTLALLGISDTSNGSGTTSSTLKLGSNGSLTKYLQRLLSALGYTVTIDGYFGTATETVVKSFQTKYSLDADGVVGGGTWSKIFSLYKVNPTGSTGAEKMVNVAKHELAWGFVEDNANNITPYGQWYGMNYAAWCAMFVSWCAYQAGIMGTKVPQFAYCPTGVSWYRDKNKYYYRDSNYTPRIGDTVFFFSTSMGRVSHTGILIGATATTITTIEGNTSDGVFEKTYNRSNTYIDGYGCNDGPKATADISTSETTINNAVLAKGVDYMRACNNTLEKDSSTGKYIVTNSPDAVSFELGKECSFEVMPNIIVSAKVAKEYTLYNNFVNTFEDTSKLNIFEFNIVNGELKYGTSAVKDEITTSLGGLESALKQNCINIYDSLALEVENGNMKIGVEFSRDIGNSYVTIAYTVKHELDVNASCTQEISFTYAITARIPDDERDTWQPALVKIEECVEYYKENPDEALLIAAFVGIAVVFVGGVAGTISAIIAGISNLIARLA